MTAVRGTVAATTAKEEEKEDEFKILRIARKQHKAPHGDAKEETLGIFLFPRADFHTQDTHKAYAFEANQFLMNFECGSARRRIEARTHARTHRQ